MQQLRCNWMWVRWDATGVRFNLIQMPLFRVRNQRFSFDCLSADSVSTSAVSETVHKMLFKRNATLKAGVKHRAMWISSSLVFGATSIEMFWSREVLEIMVMLWLCYDYVLMDMFHRGSLRGAAKKLGHRSCHQLAWSCPRESPHCWGAQRLGPRYCWTQREHDSSDSECFL